MKCSCCNGTGEIIVPVVGTMLYGKQQCDECNGTGEVNITNEEWRKTCSAEEFAEWLAERMDTPCDICRYDCRSKCMANAKQVWLEWLKEKHNENY